MGKKKKDVAAAPVAEAKRLYNSERGQIGCTLPGHAPHKGSDTWRFDRWRAMSVADVAAFERELGHKIDCEVCVANAKRDATLEPVAEQVPPAAEPTATVDAQPAQAKVSPTEVMPAEQKPSKKKPKREGGSITLADLAQRYLGHMGREGKTEGTIFSYRLELQTALAHLGADTLLSDLTPEKVALYFGCARVNKKKNGKVKSPLSIAKTQRVLRLALVWAEKAKLIAKAPLPEDLATH